MELVEPMVVLQSPSKVEVLPNILKTGVDNRYEGSIFPGSR